MIADFVRVQPDDQNLKTNYLVTLRMIERLHRLLLDLIKDEFERVGRPTSTASRPSCCSTSATSS